MTNMVIVDPLFCHLMLTRIEMTVPWSAPIFPCVCDTGTGVWEPPGTGPSDVRDQGCCQPPLPRLSGPSDQLRGGPARPVEAGEKQRLCWAGQAGGWGPSLNVEWSVDCGDRNTQTQSGSRSRHTHTDHTDTETSDKHKVEDLGDTEASEAGVTLGWPVTRLSG